MKLFIENIIPRIQQYSLNLSKTEILVDQPWIFIDEESKKHKYIFRRNGELLMSYEGLVTTGKWEYIPNSNSLLIDRNVNKILLNHRYFDKALMYLELDGGIDKPFILLNEREIPSLDLNKYVEYIYHEKKIGQEMNDFKLFGLNDRLNLEIINDSLEINNQNATDYNNNKFKEKYRYTHIKTDKGVLRVEHEPYKRMDLNNKIFYNNFPAPDGIYKINSYHNITVENGLIINIYFFNYPILITIIIILVLIAILILASL